LDKLDLAKKYPHYYRAKTTPEIVNIEEAKYVTIVGKGAPDSPIFQKKIKAIYSVAYSIKSICKKQGKDFVVPKLEGIWWVESDKPYFEVPRKEWHWKLLIMVPDYVSQQIFIKAKEEAMKKKKLEEIEQVKLEKTREGLCVQALHIGPYDTEYKTIQKMEQYIKENNLIKNGPHHEIYLSDPRKTPPHKLKTILRQPVKKT